MYRSQLSNNPDLLKQFVDITFQDGPFGNLAQEGDLRSTTDGQGKSPVQRVDQSIQKGTHDLLTAGKIRKLKRQLDDNTADDLEFDRSDADGDTTSVFSEGSRKKSHRKSKKKKKNKLDSARDDDKENRLSKLEDSLGKIFDMLKARETPPVQQDEVILHPPQGDGLGISESESDHERESFDFKRKARKAKLAPPPKKKKANLVPITSSDSEEITEEVEEEKPRENFALKKMNLAGIIDVEGKESRAKAPSSLVERYLLADSEQGIIDYKLPLSQVVKEALIKENSVIRDITLDQAEDIGFKWTVDSLPNMGSKPKVNTIVKRTEAGLKDRRKNHYATVELPFSADLSATGSFQRQVMFHSRRDALDLLQAQSYSEHAIGAAVKLLTSAKKLSTKMKLEAADLLLSGVISLKSQVHLTGRILGNTTLACRALDLPTNTGLNEEFTNSLMTVPIQTQQPLPPMLIAEMRKLQSKSLPQVGIMCQKMTQELEQNRKSFNRGGRGRGSGPYNKGNRYQKPSAQERPTQSQRGRGGFRGRGRGRGRGMVPQNKVSTNKPAPKTK